jgi:hypothetical protein
MSDKTIENAGEGAPQRNCGTCACFFKHPHIIGKGICFGIPPSAVLVSKGGQLGQQNLRPIMDPKEFCVVAWTARPADMSIPEIPSTG